MADASVGGIVGYLRLDKSDFDAATVAAGRKIDELKEKNPNIKVSADTGKALAQLEAVAAATSRLQDAQAKVAITQSKLNDLESAENTPATKLLTAKSALAKATRDQEVAEIRLAAAYELSSRDSDHLADSTDKLAKSADRARFSVSPLALAIATLGPAAVPLTAVAGGALLGLAPVAAVAFLAIKGVSNEMYEASAAGTQFSANVAIIKSELTTLEQTAANGVFKSFAGELTGLKSTFDPLNADVAIYSGQLGTIVQNLLPGLLGFLHDLSPLFSTFGAEVVKGSEDFNKWANSTGAVSHFVGYVQAELPTVERVLAELTTTVSHLLQAFAPMGGATLTEIGLLSRAINAIPISTLQVLVPLLVDGYIALKAYQGLSAVGAVLDKTAASMLGLASAEVAVGDAAVATDLSMSALLGPIGAVVVGVGLLAATFLGGSRSAQQAKEDMDSYTQSIEADNGAIGDNTKQYLANKLVKDGSIGTAQKLGISTDQFTQAILGNKSAVTSTTAALQAIVLAGTKYISVGGRGGRGSLAPVLDSDARSAQDLIATLNGQSAAVTGGQAAAQQYSSVMKALGIDTDTATDAAADATRQMQQENDAAGLLNASLNSLAGQNLNVAQAQTSLDSAVLSATTTLKTNKGVLSENTQAGIDDRQALEGIAAALRAKAQADAAAGTSTEQVTKNYQTNSAALLDQIGKLDGTKSAAYLYLQQLLQIPPVVKTQADLDADAALAVLADLENQLKHLPGVTITSQAVLRSDAAGYSATGGLITGPGSGTSDSILRHVSNGEFVMPAAKAAMYLPQLEAMRTGSTTPLLGSSGASPAGQSFHSDYSQSASQPQVIQNHITLTLDGKVVATSVNEYNMAAGRR